MVYLLSHEAGLLYILFISFLMVFSMGKKKKKKKKKGEGIRKN